MTLFRRRYQLRMTLVTTRTTTLVITTRMTQAIAAPISLIH
jgi:hypothetical protein